MINFIPFIRRGTRPDDIEAAMTVAKKCNMEFKEESCLNHPNEPSIIIATSEKLKVTLEIQKVCCAEFKKKMHQLNMTKQP